MAPKKGKKRNMNGLEKYWMGRVCKKCPHCGGALHPQFKPNLHSGNKGGNKYGQFTGGGITNYHLA